MGEKGCMKLGCAAGLLLGLAAQSAAATQTFDSFAQYDAWYAGYYARPDAASVVPSIQYLLSSSQGKSELVAAPAASFYAAVVRQDPALLGRLAELISQGTDAQTQRFVLDVVARVATTQAQALLKKLGAESTSTGVRQYALRLQERTTRLPTSLQRARSALDLRVLWAHFCATGDPLPLRTIVSAVHQAHEGRGVQRLVGTEAERLIRTRASAHPALYAVLEEAVRTTSGDRRMRLAALIEDVDRQR